MAFDKIEKWKMSHDKIWDKKTGAELRNAAKDKNIVYIPWLPEFYALIKDMDGKCKNEGYKKFGDYVSSGGKLHGFGYIVPDAEPLLAKAKAIY